MCGDEGGAARRDGKATPHQLVCGLCKAVLDPVYGTREEAERAISDHRSKFHPERHDAVVLAVRASLLESHEQEALTIATEAQHRASDG